ncbi:MAG: chemotaxis-specific protein-glutamate methyltransferase CheB [Acidobacteriota bacterium]
MEETRTESEGQRRRGEVRPEAAKAVRGAWRTPKTRLMVVDDSAAFRALIRDVLASEDDIEIVGTASTGRGALLRIPDLTPDCILMDIQMPGIDGLKTLRLVKQQHPQIGVIICSAVGFEVADVAVEALANGALDFIPKAPQLAPGESLIGRLRDEVVSRIRAFRAYSPRAQTPPRPDAQPPLEDALCAQPGGRDVIAIGVSTGGPVALRALLQEVPADIAATILIVQHMPPVFTKRLADQLNTVSRVRVKEAEDGEEALYGTAYIAPGDYHMEVRRRGSAPAIVLTRGAPENSVRPAVDVLFRSVASTFGNRALGVVLTGMGSDGYAGSQALKARGAIVIAQDEASSVIWGMPRFVAEAGLADRVCALADMPRLIGRLVGRAQSPRAPDS